MLLRREGGFSRRKGGILKKRGRVVKKRRLVKGTGGGPHSSEGRGVAS